MPELTFAKLREVNALIDAQPKADTVEVPLEVWMLMNALADALDPEAN